MGLCLGGLILPEGYLQLRFGGLISGRALIFRGALIIRILQYNIMEITVWK